MEALESCHSYLDILQDLDIKFSENLQALSDLIHDISEAIVFLSRIPQDLALSKEVGNPLKSSTISTDLTCSHRETCSRAAPLLDYKCLPQGSRPTSVIVTLELLLYQLQADQEQHKQSVQSLSHIIAYIQASNGLAEST